MVAGTSSSRGWDQWSKMVYNGENSSLFFIPGRRDGVLRLDLESGDLHQFGHGTITSIQSAIRKFVGAAMCPRGLIYAVPYDCNHVLKVNPRADPADEGAVETLGSAQELRVLGSGKYAAAVAVGDYIIGVPFRATQVIRVDTRSDSLNLFGALPRGLNGSWGGGAVGSDGMVYCVPYNSTSVLRIDPVQCRSSLSLMGRMDGRAKWWGCVRGRDGRHIYGVPHQASTILKIHVESGALELIELRVAVRSSPPMVPGRQGSRGAEKSQKPMIISDPSRLKWGEAVLGTDSYIYGIPHDYGQLLRFCPETQTCEVTKACKWSGGVVTKEGILLGMHSQGQTLFRVDVSRWTHIVGWLVRLRYLVREARAEVQCGRKAEVQGEGRSEAATAAVTAAAEQELAPFARTISHVVTLLPETPFRCVVRFL